MDQEKLLNKLKEEGFPSVYLWKDAPGTEYKPHAHKGKVSFFITKGDVMIWFENKENVIVSAGERYDMRPGIKHWAKVGSQGCEWVVGEEIEGDA